MKRIVEIFRNVFGKERSYTVPEWCERMEALGIVPKRVERKTA